MNKKQITKEEAKAYFEEHLEFIKAIAEETSIKQKIDSEEAFQRYSDSFLRLERSGDTLSIDYEDKIIDVSSLIDDIKDLVVEHFRCYVLSGEKMVLVFEKAGSLTNSSLNNLETLELIGKIRFQHKPFYIVHNHPCVFEASPSESDFQTMDFFINLSKEINVPIIDFGIITNFDYWSMMQEIRKTN